VLDAGCGPGHWSAFLRDRGLQVQGVDATPAFLDHARSSRPDIPFALGDLRTLDLPPGSFGGVLAWFSLIHTDPEEVPGALQTFAQALGPSGSLLIGFFSGDDLRPFDHRVVTAWAWPIDAMAAAIEGAGLLVSSRREWATPNGRRNAAIVAHRPPDHPELP
jgi:SAM-dependent methyltransferase